MIATAWSARIDVETAPTEENVDTLLELLADHSPAVGTTVSGNLSMRIAVEAATAREATDTALHLIAAATQAAGLHHTVIAVEVTRWDEFEREQTRPTEPGSTSLAEATEPPGASRTHAG